MAEINGKIFLVNDQIMKNLDPSLVVNRIPNQEFRNGQQHMFRSNLPDQNSTDNHLDQNTTVPHNLAIINKSSSKIKLILDKHKQISTSDFQQPNQNGTVHHNETDLSYNDFKMHHIHASQPKSSLSISAKPIKQNSTIDKNNTVHGELKQNSTVHYNQTAQSTKTENPEASISEKARSKKKLILNKHEKNSTSDVHPSGENNKVHQIVPPKSKVFISANPIKENSTIYKNYTVEDNRYNQTFHQQVQDTKKLNTNNSKISNNAQTQNSSADAQATLNKQKTPKSENPNKTLTIENKDHKSTIYIPNAGKSEIIHKNTTNTHNEIDKNATAVSDKKSR